METYYEQYQTHIRRNENHWQFYRKTSTEMHNNNYSGCTLKCLEWQQVCFSAIKANGCKRLYMNVYVGCLMRCYFMFTADSTCGVIYTSMFIRNSIWAKNRRKYFTFSLNSRFGFSIFCCYYNEEKYNCIAVIRREARTLQQYIRTLELNVLCSLK